MEEEANLTSKSENNSQIVTLVDFMNELYKCLRRISPTKQSHDLQLAVKGIVEKEIVGKSNTDAQSVMHQLLAEYRAEAEQHPQLDLPPTQEEALIWSSEQHSCENKVPNEPPASAAASNLCRETKKKSAILNREIQRKTKMKPKQVKTALIHSVKESAVTCPGPTLAPAVSTSALAPAQTLVPAVSTLALAPAQAPTQCQQMVHHEHVPLHPTAAVCATCMEEDTTGMLSIFNKIVGFFTKFFWNSKSQCYRCVQRQCRQIYVIAEPDEDSQLQ